MELGIVTVYSGPGHPEKNPENERVHGNIKEAATIPVAWNLLRQRKIEGFRRGHREDSAYLSLNGHTPWELYSRFTRRYKGSIGVYEYLAEY